MQRSVRPTPTRPPPPIPPSSGGGDGALSASNSADATASDGRAFLSFTSPVNGAAVGEHRDGVPHGMRTPPPPPLPPSRQHHHLDPTAAPPSSSSAPIVPSIAEFAPSAAAGAPLGSQQRAAPLQRPQQQQQFEGSAILNSTLPFVDGGIGGSPMHPARAANGGGAPPATRPSGTVARSGGTPSAPATVEPTPTRFPPAAANRPPPASTASPAAGSGATTPTSSVAGATAPRATLAGPPLRFAGNKPVTAVNTPVDTQTAPPSALSVAIEPTPTRFPPSSANRPPPAAAGASGNVRSPPAAPHHNGTATMTQQNSGAHRGASTSPTPLRQQSHTAADVAGYMQRDHAGIAPTSSATSTVASAKVVTGDGTLITFSSKQTEMTYEYQEEGEEGSRGPHASKTGTSRQDNHSNSVGAAAASTSTGHQQHRRSLTANLNLSTVSGATFIRHAESESDGDDHHHDDDNDEYKPPAEQSGPREDSVASSTHHYTPTDHRMAWVRAQQEKRARQEETLRRQVEENNLRQQQELLRHQQQHHATLGVAPSSAGPIATPLRTGAAAMPLPPRSGPPKRANSPARNAGAPPAPAAGSSAQRPSAPATPRGRADNGHTSTATSGRATPVPSHSAGAHDHVAEPRPSAPEPTTGGGGLARPADVQAVLRRTSTQSSAEVVTSATHFDRSSTPADAPSASVQPAAEHHAGAAASATQSTELIVTPEPMPIPAAIMPPPSSVPSRAISGVMPPPPKRVPSRTNSPSAPNRSGTPGRVPSFRANSPSVVSRGSERTQSVAASCEVALPSDATQPPADPPAVAPLQSALSALKAELHNFPNTPTRSSEALFALGGSAVASPVADTKDDGGPPEHRPQSALDDEEDEFIVEHAAVDDTPPPAPIAPPLPRTVEDVKEDGREAATRPHPTVPASIGYDGPRHHDGGASEGEAPQQCTTLTTNTTTTTTTATIISDEAFDTAAATVADIRAFAAKISAKLRRNTDESGADPTMIHHVPGSAGESVGDVSGQIPAGAAIHHQPTTSNASSTYTVNMEEQGSDADDDGMAAARQTALLLGGGASLGDSLSSPPSRAPPPVPFSNSALVHTPVRRLISSAAQTPPTADRLATASGRPESLVFQRGTASASNNVPIAALEQPREVVHQQRRQQQGPRRRTAGGGHSNGGLASSPASSRDTSESPSEAYATNTQDVALRGGPHGSDSDDGEAHLVEWKTITVVLQEQLLLNASDVAEDDVLSSPVRTLQRRTPLPQMFTFTFPSTAAGRGRGSSNPAADAANDSDDDDPSARTPMSRRSRSLNHSPTPSGSRRRTGRRSSTASSAASSETDSTTTDSIIAGKYAHDWRMMTVGELKELIVAEYLTWVSKHHLEALLRDNFGAGNAPANAAAAGRGGPAAPAAAAGARTIPTPLSRAVFERTTAPFSSFAGEHVNKHTYTFIGRDVSGGGAAATPTASTVGADGALVLRSPADGDDDHERHTQLRTKILVAASLPLLGTVVSSRMTRDGVPLAETHTLGHHDYRLGQHEVLVLDVHRVVDSAVWRSSTGVGGSPAGGSIHTPASRILDSHGLRSPNPHAPPLPHQEFAHAPDSSRANGLIDSRPRDERSDAPAVTHLHFNSAAPRRPAMRRTTMPPQPTDPPLNAVPVSSINTSVCGLDSSTVGLGGYIHRPSIDAAHVTDDSDAAFAVPSAAAPTLGALYVGYPTPKRRISPASAGINYFSAAAADGVDDVERAARRANSARRRVLSPPSTV